MSDETLLGLHQPTLAKLAADNALSGLGYKVLFYLLAASSDTHDVRQVAAEMGLPEPSVRKAIEQHESIGIATMLTETVFKFTLDNYLPEVPGKKKLVLTEEEARKIF